MIQIHKSTSDFIPHIALCHMEFNGGSANGENIPLIQKAAKDGAQLNTVLKALGMDDSEVVEKASYENMRRMLYAHLGNLYNTDYTYIIDFDESTVVFEAGNKTYSIPHSMDDAGNILLGTEPREVVRQEIYVSVEGDELVLKSDNVEVENPAIDAEVIKSEGITPIIDKEESMEQVEIKDTVDIEALVLKAKQDTEAAVRAEIAAELAEKELVKSAQSIVKGFPFISEGDVEAVVKALVLADEVMVPIVKALEAANEKIAAVELEKEEIKKEFGTQKSVGDKPNVDQVDKEANLEFLVKQRLAAKAAAKQ